MYFANTTISIYRKGYLQGYKDKIFLLSLLPHQTAVEVSFDHANTTFNKASLDYFQ